MAEIYPPVISRIFGRVLGAYLGKFLGVVSAEDDNPVLLQRYSRIMYVHNIQGQPQSLPDPLCLRSMQSSRERNTFKIFKLKTKYYRVFIKYCVFP